MTDRHGKKDRKTLIITSGFVILGLFLMIYPFVSNYLYEYRTQDMFKNYSKTVKKVDASIVQEMFIKAEAYNRWLNERNVILTDPFDPELQKDENEQDYQQLLNLNNDGIMGYVEIPNINIFLPIYHGTSAEVLDKGVGHLEYTSFPVGGENTHCVLSAHTGLSDKKLFTDLLLLENGDTFYLKVADKILAYEVDQILVVKPEDTSALRIVSGEDYVTLVTCTPYGVNSHRLLVRGHRIPYQLEKKEAVKKTDKVSPWMRQYFLLISMGLVLLCILMVVLHVLKGRRK